MANAARGLALGGAAASFRAADQRAVQREGIQAGRDIAAGVQTGQNERQQIKIAEEQRKSFVEETKAVSQALFDKMSDLTASITSETTPIEAAKIVRERDMVAKQLETLIGGLAGTRPIPGGEPKPNPNSSPGVFSILGQKLSAANRAFNLQGAKSKAEAIRKGQALELTAKSGGAAAKGLEAKEKLDVEIQAIQKVMQDAGLSPEASEAAANDPVVSEAIQNPLEGGEQASDDMREYTRRLALARAFGAVGMTEQGRFQLAIADSIAENSPSIRQNRELDKIASPALTQLAGTNVGDTVRQVRDKLRAAGAKLPTVREQARERTLGKKSVEAEESIAFVGEAQIIIGGVLDEFEGKGEFLGKANENIFGVLGSVFAGTQTFLAVMSDLRLTSLVDQARDLAFDSELSSEEQDALFDSDTLSVLNLIEHSVGMIIARLRTKEGRLLAKVVNDAMQDARLTGLKGGKQIAAKLKRISRQLGRRKASLEKRFDLVGGEQPGETVFEFKGGKFVPVQ